MKELEVAMEAAKTSGKILLEYYDKVVTNYKKDKSIVTEADVKSEENIKSILSKHFPSYSFLGEESGLQDKKSEYLWIVDPLDGTTNFSIKNPFFNVSIALSKNNKPILGVVYYPFQDELFYAERGSDAFLNDKKIHVSDKDDITKSIHTFCHGNDPEQLEDISRIFRLFKLKNPKFRQFGSAALELCFVASGRVESYLMVGVNSWDVAAGVVIVEEAGGKVTDLSGGEFTTESKTILVSNGRLHEKIIEIINE